ncbi:hypothetical protein E2C01_093062 [Portunus trituberculatus]|uniref:Uncharacterized protein n=1 Tax=Portunus trituberculatus TaxID=210409 RepID=A0A5B7JTI8_PORTR|nr:hypothetical protein [Portunus trituberculatus]
MSHQRREYWNIGQQASDTSI